MLLLPTLLSLLTIAATTVALNPQPLPPGHHISPAGERDLNPQPLPPGRKTPIYERDSCAPSYVKCAPPGATGTSIPVIGPAVKGLYLNVLQSVQGDKLGVKKRDLILDPAGFPNGRRVFDDVVAIELSAIGGARKRDIAETSESMKRQPLFSSEEHSGRSLQDLSVRALNLGNRELRRTGINADKRATTVQMCCAAGTQCLLLQDFNVPFCWPCQDKFTTNFFLPFSSYGSLTTGNYTSPAPPNAPSNSPSDVNLLSGNYTRPDGSSGNIYSDDEAAKPNTATLGSLMPTPWTSTGVGSAIPASALGGIATWTTVIEGITVEPTVVGGSTVAGKTIAPVTTTVTGFEETASSTAAANSTSSKGVASGGHGAEEWATRMAVAVAGMLCAVMGL